MAHVKKTLTGKGKEINIKKLQVKRQDEEEKSGRIRSTDGKNRSLMRPLRCGPKIKV